MEDMLEFDGASSSAMNRDGRAVSKASQKELQNALYARCANLSADRTFDQNELLELQVIPNDDLRLLQTCLGHLTKEGLFKLMKKNDAACWKVVKREDAARSA